MDGTIGLEKPGVTGAEFRIRFDPAGDCKTLPDRALGVRIDPGADAGQSAPHTDEDGYVDADYKEADDK